MKKISIALLIIALALSGCVSSQNKYQVTTTVSRIKESQQYHVSFKIKKAEKLISSPSIVVDKGEDASIQISTDDEPTGIFCTVLVVEDPKQIKAVTGVVIKSKGKIDFSSTQTMSIDNHAEQNGAPDADKLRQ